MVSIMDSTEAQLRYGSALASAGDPGHPNHPLHASQNSARRERMTAREEASLRTLEGRRYAILHVGLYVQTEPLGPRMLELFDCCYIRPHSVLKDGSTLCYFF